MHIHLAGLWCSWCVRMLWTSPSSLDSKRAGKKQGPAHIWDSSSVGLPGTGNQLPREKRSWSTWKSSLFRATPELILPSRGDWGIFCGLQQPMCRWSGAVTRLSESTLQRRWKTFYRAVCPETVCITVRATAVCSSRACRSRSHTCVWLWTSPADRPCRYKIFRITNST